jgi:hypothetical protein
MKRIAVLAMGMALVLAAVAGAEEPVASLSFTQEVDTGITDSEAAGNYLSDGDVIYLSTEMLAGVTFTFGTVTVMPWVSALYETGDGSGAPYQLGTASLGADSAFSISEMFNVYFNVGMSWEVETGGELTPYLTPVLGFNGAVAGLSYDLSGDLVIYFYDDGTDMDIEAVLELGYALPAGLAVTLTDEFCYELDQLDGELPAMTNDLSLVLSGAIGPLAPYAGPIFDISVYDGENDMLLVGFTAGIDVSVDAWTFGLSYSGGSETKSETMPGVFSAVLGLEL